MSSIPNEENVEETKRQIRMLVNEISDLSKSDAVADEYYPNVLQKVVSALAAVGGAVWLLDEDGALRLSYQIQMDPMLRDATNPDAIRHGRLLAKVLQQGKPELIPANSSFGENHEMGNPTMNLLILAPLIGSKQAVGLMEIFQRADSQPDAQRGYIRIIDHICKIIAEWLKGHALQKVSDRQNLYQSIDQFARLVHDNLDIRDTSYTIANEGRRLIECDRVSVAIVKGRQAKVKAISGQDTIENRSNIVAALNDLATRVVRSGEPLWYDGSTEDLPPQIEVAVENYIDQSHGRTVSVLPIYRPEKMVDGDVLTARNVAPELRSRGPAIGALIIEQIETQLDRNTLQGRADLVYEHSCRALSNALAHSSIFLMPVWKFLDRALWMFRGSALPKTLATLGLLAAALIAACIVRIDFDLKGNGEFKPSVEKNIFANVDGEIEKVHVSHNSIVEPGQSLVTMKNRDLEVELENLRGQLSQAQARKGVIENQLTKPNLPESDRWELSGQQAEVDQQIANFLSQLRILIEKKNKLQIVSPIKGVVTTWDVEKKLVARPAVMGQLLLNVADLSNAWEIEVLMPEKRMKHLDNALNAAKDGYLPCEFRLKSAPDKTHTGKLRRADIHQRAEVVGEEGTVVKLRVIPDSLEGIKPWFGTQVIADVKCGKAPLAWVWLYQPIEFLRSYVFF